MEEAVGRGSVQKAGRIANLLKSWFKWHALGFRGLGFPA